MYYVRPELSCFVCGLLELTPFNLMGTHFVALIIDFPRTITIVFLSPTPFGIITNPFVFKKLDLLTICHTNITILSLPLSLYT
jgi:hypothetical protein